MSSLNRLAWIASMALAFSLPTGIFSSDFSLFGVLIGVIVGIFIKKVFLPEDLFEDIAVTKPFNTKKISDIVAKEEKEEPDTIEEVIQKKPVITKKAPEPVMYTKPEPKKPNPIIAWFAENTLAKLGGILIFLAVLAFLTVIYAAIGPMGRLIISILVSLSIFGGGVYLFRKKDFTHEAQIVLGVGVTAVYLSLLYIFRVPVFMETFGATLPYIVLSLLTLAVAWGSITGMIFGSPILFVFSIAVAYLNPYLIGVSLTTIQLLIYVLLISGGAIATASFLIREKQQETLGAIVLHIGFWGGLITCIFADKISAFDLNITLLMTVILTATTTWTASYLKDIKVLSTFLIGGGIGLFVTLLTTEVVNTLSSTAVLSMSLMALILIMWSCRKRISVEILLILLTLPIFIWVVGYITGFWFAPVIVFGGMIFFYAIILMIFEMIPVVFSSILFVVFGIIGMFFTPSIFQDLTLGSRYLLMGIGGFLFVFGHYFSLKKNISITPIIHTLTSLGLLVMNRPGTSPFWAILAIILLTIATVGVSFYAYRRRLESTLDHICVPLIGAASLISTLIYYGAIQAHWGIMLGAMLLVIATLYVSAFMFILNPLGEKVETHMTITFLGIAASITTLAIAYLFSGYENARALAWLIEAALIWWVYAKYPNPWIQASAVLVQIVGMIQFVLIEPTLDKNLVLYSVTLLLPFWNLGCLKREGSGKTVLSEIILFISVAVWYIYLFDDISRTWSDTAIILSTQGFLIGHFLWQSFIFKKNYFGGLMLALVFFWIAYISPDQYSNPDVFHTRWIYLLAPFVFFPMQNWLNYKQPHILTKINWFIVGVGTFIVTSVWMSQHFSNPYIISLWWSIWIGGLLTLGIQKGTNILRSLGLLVYILTLLRIVFIDLGRIFMSEGGTGVFVGIGIVLLLGVVSIGLSMLYKRLLGEGALKKDFLFQNEGKTMPTGINEILSKIDISDVTGVVFHTNSGKKIQPGKSINLKKIAKYVVKTTGKTQFAAGELQELYDIISTDIKSDYSPKGLEAAKKIMKEFVDVGGSIEIQK